MNGHAADHRDEVLRQGAQVCAGGEVALGPGPLEAGSHRRVPGAAARGQITPELDAAVRALGGADVAVGVRGDVSNLADLDRLYATIKERKGRLDVLFANAGSGEFARPAKVKTKKAIVNNKAWKPSAKQPPSRFRKAG